MINRVKGTQDFLDLTLFNFLLNKAKEHLTCYHFHEIATPILEPTELFLHSLGTETDVVSKEMYILPSKSENQAEPGESICLRPEVTASIMRAFLNNGVATTPWKVFTWGPMFRYERPQKGRFRQFHQISIEIIGSNAVAQDAYFITMLDQFFTQKLSLTDYGLLINYMGCSQDRQNFKELLHKFLEQHVAQICNNCLHRKEKNILRVLDCKTPSCQELYQKAPIITEHLCPTCTAEWQELQTLLQQLSVPYSIANNLVRGLDYYSKTVFEFVSIELGAQNTFCGGGRYNSLATALGAKTDQPSIGAAIGIERVLMMLAQLSDITIPLPPRLHAIIPLTPAQIQLSLQVADMLHAHDFCTEIFVEGDSLKSNMRQANKLGARYAILIGPDEQQAGTVTLKEMVTGTEHKMPQRDLISYLQQNN